MITIDATISGLPPGSTASCDRFENSGQSVGKTSMLDTAPDSSNFQFVREDWTLFRSLSTIGQKAGVPENRLVRLVLKELVDNALDAGSTCTITEDDGTFIVQDQGPGLPPDQVPTLFSIRRPLSSSKLWRLPTRGAMGNGLRVVAGVVLAMQGELTVWTRGRMIKLHSQDDGTTKADISDAPDFHTGTRIAIRLGDVAGDSNPMLWANLATRMANHGQSYTGRTSPAWYGPAAFFELCRAAGGRSVRELIERFDGCTGAKAGSIAKPFKGRTAGSLSRSESRQLLLLAQREARSVPASRLGRVGSGFDPDAGYGRKEGSVHDESSAAIPFIVEAWANRGPDSLTLCVNRTPVTGETRAYHTADDRTYLSVFGCGLSHKLPVGRDRVTLLVNITTPYMPITTDGKEPDLTSFLAAIVSAVSQAARAAKRLCPKADKETTQKSVIAEHLNEAGAQASGNGVYRFSQRQLFYAIRPHIIRELGKEPDSNYFGQVITDIEAEQGEIAGMYRLPRGFLYHPHLHDEIPLGTKAVETYRRPEWTFNKILYCEKEGFISIMREAGWPERHDCALLTSQGYASRAVRDVIDLLGEDGEPLEFFCVHDGDAYGTMIYQSLQEVTKSRPGRKVRIVNLGLEPDEGLEMGLEVEKVTGDTKRPVAKYVDQEWKAWLQSNRIELNAMSTPQFIQWLDQKMAVYGGKVIPPNEVLSQSLEQQVRTAITERLTAEVLANADIDGLVQAAMLQIQPDLSKVNAGLSSYVSAELARSPEDRWTSPIEVKANAIAMGKGGDR